MMVTRRPHVALSRSAGACAALVVLAATAAGAQTLAAPPPPPTAGLFARASQQRPRSLLATGSFLGAYDDDLLSSNGNTVGDPRQQQRGSYGVAVTRLTFTHAYTRFQFGVSGTSAARYYPTLSQLVAVQHGGSASGAFHAGGMRLEGSATLDYLPLFAFMSVPRLFDASAVDVGAPGAITFDQVAMQRRARQLGSSVRLTQTLGKRMDIGAYGSRESSDFSFGSTALTTQTVGARFSRHLTRSLSIVTGISSQQADYGLSTGGARTIRVQSIDTGLDYSRALGRRRRTTVGFTSGLTAIQDDANAKPYRMIGDVRVRRLIARTWNLTGAFTRGVGFLPGVDRPVFSDAVSINASGAFTRRVDLMLAGAYSKGQIGFVTSNNQTEAFSGSARLRIGLTRHTALSTEYLVYHYMFEVGARPIGIPPSMNRHGARVGFDVWLPFGR